MRGRHQSPWERATRHTRVGGIIALVMVFVYLASLAVAQSYPPPLAASTTTGAPASATIQQAADPCLEEDPFELEQLEQVLSRNEPFSVPIEINRFVQVAFIGTGELVDIETEEPFGSPEDAQGPSNPPERPPDTIAPQDLQLRVFNTRTKFEFELTLNGGMLQDIHRCHTEAGLTSATVGSDDPAGTDGLNAIFMPLVTQPRTGSTTAAQPGAVAPAAWSNGVDNRIIINNTTAWPWRTIVQFRRGGQQNSSCTGTLIGPRHVVTAAHCINSFGTNNWKSRFVTPGKNGAGSTSAQEPFGSSFIQPNPPSGIEAWYFTHPQWRNPATSNPRQWDWGMIVIPNRLGNQTGWMGYVARPASALNTVTHYNRGYPRCNPDRTDNPPACNPPTFVNPNLARLHGDTQPCRMGTYSRPGPDGWNRLITHSCDTSAGHSGSPVYHYFRDPRLNNQWVPVVAMVHVASLCQQCTPSDNYPSVARRHTPAELNIISFFRELFP